MSPRKESRVVANKPLRRGFDPDVRLSKVEVMAAGVIAYWTGKPCKNGHLAHRYVCNSIFEEEASESFFVEAQSCYTKSRDLIEDFIFQF